MRLNLEIYKQFTLCTLIYFSQPLLQLIKYFCQVNGSNKINVLFKNNKITKLTRN
jgi:hypothetical protein